MESHANLAKVYSLFLDLKRHNGYKHRDITLFLDMISNMCVMLFRLHIGVVFVKIPPKGLIKVALIQEIYKELETFLYALIHM